MKNNTSSLWDKFWKEEASGNEICYLTSHLRSIRWKRLKNLILSRFGTFKNLEVIELGAGKGTYSLLFALEGAKVTLLDYSQEALKKARIFFNRFGIRNAKFIKMDILKLNKKLYNKYDVAISVGVAEHFRGTDRKKVIKTHFDVIRKGCLAIIDVPNKWNAPYRLWKFLSQTFGKWNFGEEIPYSRREFKKIGKELGINFKFIGGYLFEDPFLIKKRIKKLLGIKEKLDPNKIKFQLGTPLDEYFSRTLIAVGEK